MCYSDHRHVPYPLTYLPPSNRTPSIVDGQKPLHLISTIVLLSYVRHCSRDDSGSYATSGGEDTGTGLFSLPAASILPSIQNLVLLTTPGNASQGSNQLQGNIAGALPGRRNIDRSDPTLLCFSRLTLTAVMDQVAIHIPHPRGILTDTTI